MRTYVWRQWLHLIADNHMTLKKTWESLYGGILCRSLFDRYYHQNSRKKQCGCHKNKRTAESPGFSIEESNKISSCKCTQCTRTINESECTSRNVGGQDISNNCKKRTIGCV